MNPGSYHSDNIHYDHGQGSRHRRCLSRARLDGRMVCAARMRQLLGLGARRPRVQQLAHLAPVGQCAAHGLRADLRLGSVRLPPAGFRGPVRGDRAQPRAGGPPQGGTGAHVHERQTHRRLPVGDRGRSPDRSHVVCLCAMLAVGSVMRTVSPIAAVILAAALILALAYVAQRSCATFAAWTAAAFAYDNLVSLILALAALRWLYRPIHDLLAFACYQLGLEPRFE